MRVLWLTAAALVLDQIVKLTVLHNMSLHTPSIPLVGDWFKLTYTTNPGMAFGVTLGPPFVVTAFAVLATLLIVVYLRYIRHAYAPYRASLALILGGATGVATNLLLQTGLAGPAAPGSIIAVGVQAGLVGGMNLVGVLLSVLLAAAVTFLVAAVILRASRKRDLERADAGDLSAAIERTQANKGKESSVLAGLAAGGAAGAGAGAASDAARTAEGARPIQRIVFACDAGMGSSAMGASVLRSKMQKAGLSGVDVTNVAIANLDGTEDLVITHRDLTDRARQRTPDALHVSVENFMSSPKYDEVVAQVADSQEA